MEKSFILAEIYRQNRQWTDQKEFFFDLREVDYKRELFFTLEKNLARRQIISIAGLRRVGKTVLIKQLIRQLLAQGTNPKDTLFLSFDEALFPEGVDLGNYLNIYLKKIALSKSKKYIFLDEIQHGKKWQHIVKRYYDTQSGLKFILSGSSSLFLKKKTTESLAGRIFEFDLPPLTLEEYLELEKAEKDLIAGYKEFAVDPRGAVRPKAGMEKHVLRHGADMEKLFEEYLKYKQFPEMIKEKEDSAIKKYLSESIYKKTIEYDIPKIFKAEKIDELKFIFQVLASEAGSVIETGNIAREASIEKKTLKKYLNYFEESFLIHLLYNFSKSLRKSRRLLKKVYLGSTNFAGVFSDFQNPEIASRRIGFMAENYFFLLLRRYFQFISFYRIRQNEFDFLAADDLRDQKNFYLYEVKYRDDLNSGEFRFLQREARKLNRPFTIVSKNTLEIEDNYSIIPAWMFK